MWVIILIIWFLGKYARLPGDQAPFCREYFLHGFLLEWKVGTFWNNDFEYVGFKKQPVYDSFGELSDGDVFFQTREHGVWSTAPSSEAYGGDVVSIAGMESFFHKNKVIIFIRFIVFLFHGFIVRRRIRYDCRLEFPPATVGQKPCRDAASLLWYWCAESERIDKIRAAIFP